MNANFSRRVVCFVRGDAQQQNSAELLSKIKKTIESPLRVIKEITNPREIKRTLQVNIAPWGDLCLHEYRWNPRRVVLSPFRLSRGERTWRFYDDIIRNQVFVPEPVLFLEIKELMFITKTYVATRWIEGGFKLDQLALSNNIPYSFDFRSILYKCVDALASLHNAGFIHGDLKWSNLLYAYNRDPDIVLTDLDSLKKTSSIWMQGRDFARFLIPPDQYLFEQETVELLIEKYLGGRGRSRSLLKKVIRGYIAKRKR